MFIKFIGYFFLLFIFECLFVLINIVICVSRWRRMFEEGDNVFLDVVCVFCFFVDFKMWFGWLKLVLKIICIILF